MSRTLATASTGVVLTARAVTEAHASATIALLSDGGRVALVPSVRTSFAQVSTRAAQAVLSRPQNAAAFRSLRKGAARAADRAIARALVRGNDVASLGRELRTLIAGAEGFEAVELRDMRQLNHQKLAAIARRMGREGTLADVRELRETAGAVARQGALVARTELMNGEHEAAVQAAVASPVAGSALPSDAWPQNRPVHQDRVQTAAARRLRPPLQPFSERQSGQQTLL